MSVHSCCIKMLMINMWCDKIILLNVSQTLSVVISRRQGWTYSNVNMLKILADQVKPPLQNGERTHGIVCGNKLCTLLLTHGQLSNVEILPQLFSVFHSLIEWMLYHPPPHHDKQLLASHNSALQSTTWAISCGEGGISRLYSESIYLCFYGAADHSPT